MRSVQQVEAWVLDVVDRIRGGSTIEDSTVELKADWPDPADAARRIAGHLNAARGNEVLWIIGLDQRTGPVARTPTELANWWPQVQSRFDEVAPSMVDVTVPIGDGLDVVALLFENDRAPYVVKAPDGLKIHREVPWRDGTGIRTARRSDLVRLLVPLHRSPTLGLDYIHIAISPQSHIERTGPDTHVQTWGPDLHVSLNGWIYFTCPLGSHVVFPISGCSGYLAVEPSGQRIPLTISLGAGADPKAQQMLTVKDGIRQLIVDGHGPARLRATGGMPLKDGQPPAIDPKKPVTITLTLKGIELAAPVVLQADVQPYEDSYPLSGVSAPVGIWRFGSNRPWRI